MNIKPVPTISPYQVNNATGTTDHERGQKENRPKVDREEEKKNSALRTTEENKTEQVTMATGDSLPSQIIDSEKVIELLSRSVPNPSYLKNVFKKSSIKISAESPTFDVKKLNRIL